MLTPMPTPIAAAIKPVSIGLRLILRNALRMLYASMVLCPMVMRMLRRVVDHAEGYFDPSLCHPAVEYCCSLLQPGPGRE